MTHPDSASAHPAAHRPFWRFFPLMYLLGPLSLLSLAMWLYPPAKIFNSIGQRVGAEGIPNGDRRIARRYRANQSASFMVGDYGRYRQTPDDSRVLIEIALLWLLAAGGAITWRHLRRAEGRGAAPPGAPADDSFKLERLSTQVVEKPVDDLAPPEEVIENLRRRKPDHYTRIAVSIAVQQVRALYTVAHEAGNESLLRSVQILDRYFTGQWIRDADVSAQYSDDTRMRGEGNGRHDQSEHQRLIPAQKDGVKLECKKSLESGTLQPGEEPVEAAAIPGYVDPWKHCAICAHFEVSDGSLMGMCTKFDVPADHDGGCPMFEKADDDDESGDVRAESSEDSGSVPTPMGSSETPSTILRYVRCEIVPLLTRVVRSILGMVAYVTIVSAVVFLLRGPRREVPYLKVVKEDYCVSDLSTLDTIRLLRRKGHADAVVAIAEHQNAFKFSPATADSVPIFDWHGESVRIEVRPSWYLIGGVSCWMDRGSIERGDLYQ